MTKAQYSFSSQAHDGCWLRFLRRYLLVILVGNLAWETVQTPLYTIWRTGTDREIVFAVLHCTGGDVLIAMACLVLALVACGTGDWPQRGYVKVAGITVILGIAYTIYSEWLNTIFRQTWAYSAWMPILPWLKTGLSPLLQWCLIPAAGFYICHRRRNVRPPAAGMSITEF